MPPPRAFDTGAGKLRVLFAIGNGFFPEFSGGVQSSTQALVHQLQRDGHQAGVLASLFGNGLFGLKARVKMKLSGRRVVMDQVAGYPVVRAWHPWEEAAAAVEQLRPDVAVVQCHKSVPMAKALQDLGIPLVVYLRNVEFHELAGDLRELHSVRYIANSKFTARTYKAKYGVDSVVIPPTIEPRLYRTSTTGKFVTLINPSEEKGLGLAIEIARLCPEIPFLFVESWTLPPAEWSRIEQLIAPLGNVTLERRTSDMRTVYSRTKILLAPSKWEEAWGRVASEAQCSGIPVVGSDRGGLPEAIGDGGIALSHDLPVEAWAARLRELWMDGNAYARYSKAAEEYAQRAELDPEAQFKSFLSVLDQARTASATATHPVKNRG